MTDPNDNATLNKIDILGMMLWKNTRDHRHENLEAAIALGAPEDEIASLQQAEMHATQRYYEFYHRIRRRSMGEAEITSIFTSKGGYTKWEWPIKGGTLSGAQIYAAVRAPLWGSLALEVEGNWVTLERDETYRIPEDIPHGAVLRSNW